MSKGKYVLSYAQSWMKGIDTTRAPDAFLTSHGLISSHLKYVLTFLWNLQVFFENLFGYTSHITNHEKDHVNRSLFTDSGVMSHFNYEKIMSAGFLLTFLWIPVYQMCDVLVVSILHTTRAPQTSLTD